MKRKLLVSVGFSSSEDNREGRLSTTGAAHGVDPDGRDIAYYAPWGNLAIFYRDFGYSSGLVKLGSIDSGIQEVAAMSGDFTVTIELAD